MDRVENVGMKELFGKDAKVDAKALLEKYEGEIEALESFNDELMEEISDLQTELVEEILYNEQLEEDLNDLQAEMAEMYAKGENSKEFLLSASNALLERRRSVH